MGNTCEYRGTRLFRALISALGLPSSPHNRLCELEGLRQSPAMSESAALQQAGTERDVLLDERRMYVVEWQDGAVFGFTVTPVKSDRGTVLCLARRTTAQANLFAAGLQDVVPGDMLIAIGDEKVYHLGAENATKYLRSVRKPVRLTMQLSPYGAAAQDVPALAPNEYHYVWESGPLGIVLTTDPDSKLPVVKRLTGKADNPVLERDVSVGDELVYVNEMLTRDYSIAKIIDIIKDLPKPITLRFRRPVADSMQVAVPELAEDEYDFLWDVGPLGLVVGTSRDGLPFVRSFTGKGTSRQLSLVQESDEIVMVNDRSSKDMGFTETMNYIMNVPKPAVIRFRRRQHSQRLSAGSTSSNGSNRAAGVPPLSPTSQMAGLAIGSSSPSRRTSAASQGDRSRASSGAPNTILGYRGSRAGSNAAAALARAHVQSPNLPPNLSLPPNMAMPPQHPPLQMDDLAFSYGKSPPQQLPRASQPATPQMQFEDEFFEIDTQAYYQIQWTDGPFGFTVREAHTKRGPVLLVTKRTGRETCKGLRRVAVGDILIKIGEKDVTDLGFERATLALRNSPKPVILTFQAID